MRKLLIILLLFPLLCSAQYGQYIGAGSGTTKLLLHLNGNSTDVSGNGNNGTDSLVTYGLSYGKFGQGASFNGTASKIKFADSSSLRPTGAFTFSAWVLKTNITTSQFAIIFQSFSQNTSLAGIRISQGNLDGQMQFIIGKNTGTTVNVDYKLLGTNFKLVNNIWVNIVCTYNGSNTMKIYINGNLDNQLTDGFQPVYATVNYVRIGCRQTTPTTVDRFWYGNIDEAFLDVNKEWTSSEIKRYYTYTRAWFYGLNEEQKHDIRYLDWFIPKQSVA